MTHALLLFCLLTPLAAAAGFTIGKPVALGAPEHPEKP